MFYKPINMKRPFSRHLRPSPIGSMILRRYAISTIHHHFSIRYLAIWKIIRTFAANFRELLITLMSLNISTECDGCNLLPEFVRRHYRWW